MQEGDNAGTVIGYLEALIGCLEALLGYVIVFVRTCTDVYGLCISSVLVANIVLRVSFFL